MAPAAESSYAILIGTGSGLELVNGILQINPGARVAVIDKDEPGGHLPKPRLHPFKDPGLLCG